MSQSLSNMAYLGAAVLFILSLGGLSNPETSRRGNLFGMIGMGLAVLATVLGPRVTPALHTPLMSVTNAISSIIAIGALVQIAPPMLGAAVSIDGRPDGLIRGLAFVALVLTAINMFGGFAVTRRMLDMFRK